MRVGRTLHAGFALWLLLPCASEAQVTEAPDLWAQRVGQDVLLSWSAVPNATFYIVYRSDRPEGPFQFLDQTSGLSYQDLLAVPAPPSEWFYLVAGDDSITMGPPSNMAFKLNIPLEPGATHVVLPYRYTPSGLGPPATAQDLCLDNDLLVSVTGMEGDCWGLPSTHNCGSPLNDFELQPGTGLFVSTDTAGSLDLVGAHDPDFEPGGTRWLPIRPCPRCEGPGVNWVGLPYHARVATAAELCQELAALGSPAYAIQDFMRERGLWLDHRCGTPIKDFPLEPGVPYWVLSSESIDWQPEVW
jgi:hypothetical protein